MTNNDGQQISEKVLKKLKKALVLAEAKDDHESHTAMLLAQQMMAKYGIDYADIASELGVAPEKEIIEMYATKPTKLQWWQKDLASVIAGNFRCFTFWRTGGGKSRVVFLGIKQDTQIAREVFLYAQDSIEYFSIRYLNERGVEGMSQRTRVRNDYISGFISGLGRRFAEQVDENDWGLILVKDNEVIERHDNMKFTKDSASSAQTAGDFSAYQAGVNDGKKMDHSKKVLK